MHRLKNDHCQIVVGIMKEESFKLREGAYPSAVEELMVDSRNADESVKEDVDEYFGDDCMSDKHDSNSSDFCYLGFT